MNFPDLPNTHALISMLLTVAALYLFTRDKIPLELTSLTLLTVISVIFAVFPYPGVHAVDFFSGFGHEALIAVCALMVVGQGLVLTGALEPVGRILGRYWSKAPFLLFAATLILGGVLSAFVNNTPIVVLLLPILISVCLRTNTSASKVLMPMGFATLVGGMATTIGTSTNLLVVSVAADLGLPRMSMFEFAAPAAVAGGVAFLYLWFIAPKILPNRDIGLEDSSPRLFDARLHIDAESVVAGKSLAEAMSLTGGDMKVSRIRRGDAFVFPLPDVVLKEGDKLRVKDTPNNLKSFEQALKATLHTQEYQVDSDHPLQAENQVLAEIAVVPGSVLDRANMNLVHFLDRYQLVALALHRAGKDIWHQSEDIGEVTLQQGDVLLVQGAEDQMHRLKSNSEFLVLDANVDLPHTAKAPLALIIMAAVVILAATGILPIAVSALAGAALMLATRCLRIGAAIRAISPSVFFVVVASLALGKALVETEATLYLTDAFLYATYGAEPWVILSALMALLAVLTNVVSNNAAAVIGTPIAVAIAAKLGLPHEPFILAVLFGANMSFATPMAYKTNLLVMSAGNYTFMDFVKVGVPLSILMWMTLTWVLKVFYL